MTETYYRTGNYKPDHSAFGGKVYDYDFDGYHSMTDITNRILSDLKFDNACRKNCENRDRKKNLRKEFRNTYGK